MDFKDWDIDTLMGTNYFASYSQRDKDEEKPSLPLLATSVDKVQMFDSHPHHCINRVFS
jgi:hypothetical protein